MKSSPLTSKTESNASFHPSYLNKENKHAFFSQKDSGEMFFGPTTLQPKLEIGRQQVIQRQTNRVHVSSPVVDESLRQAGAVAGEKLALPLSPGERTLAESVFYQSIDYDRVRVSRVGPSWTVSGNVIFVPSDFTLSNDGHAATFIHELVHVWQYQHLGSSYISTSLGRQLASFVRTMPIVSLVPGHVSVEGWSTFKELFSGSRQGAYDYELTPGASMFDYMPEQQADIVMNYFRYRQQKDHFEELGRTVPANLENDLQQHRELVDQLRHAVPPSEMEIIQQDVQRTMMQMGGEDFGGPDIRSFLRIEF